MDALKEFSIPIKGLGIGVHEYDFEIDDSFFKHFENSPVQQGKLMLHLSIDKQSSMYVLDFDFEGGINTACDRCLADIMLPTAGSQRLLVKFSEDVGESDDDIIYISRDAAFLNIAQYAFEYICLAIPISKVYDCHLDEPMPCNEKVVNYLMDNNEEKIQNNKDNPLWDALKNLK